MSGPAPAELDPRTKRLLEGSILSNIVRLAVPNTTVMAVQVIIGLLEVYFVSGLGVDALAGVSQVFPLVSLMIAVSQGAVGGGIVTAIARCLGRGELRSASEYAWYSLAFSAVFGLLTTTVMECFGSDLYRLMGAHDATLEIANSYSRIIFGGVVLMWSFNLLMASIRGTGNLVVPVVVVCSCAVIVIPLSPFLIYGGWGMHGLGAAGGAVAMLVYYGMGTVAYGLFIWLHKGVLMPTKSVPRLTLAPALGVLRIGGMSALVGSSTNLTLAIVTAYVGLHGTEALAGYGSASRLEFLLVPLSYGVGGPVGILVSTNLGAGQVDRAVKASWLGVAIAAGVTEAIGVCAALLPDVWTGIFTSDPVVQSVGAQYLRVVGPFFGFFGIGYVLYCTGQATGRLALPVFGALTRAAIAIVGGYLLLGIHGNLRSNFVAVSVGMVCFGLAALPALVARVGYKPRSAR
ncbi:MATE family efflux transporter [Tardiphaga sp. P9-11]|uniref:MATE family efflux transporter n=1 Tax=Tardiphaga sp. P9-11 TaxID=2024614 RepID=UPI0015626586|nr:MATE family efflux transporter [Tardiphaga sp. P9-11]